LTKFQHLEDAGKPAIEDRALLQLYRTVLRYQRVQFFDHLEVCYPLDSITRRILLSEALRAGKDRIVFCLMRRVQPTSDGFADLLALAAEYGRIDLIRHMLSQRIPKELELAAEQALESAIRGGHFGVVKFFLERGIGWDTSRPLSTLRLGDWRHQLGDDDGMRQFCSTVVTKCRELARSFPRQGSNHEQADHICRVFGYERELRNPIASLLSTPEAFSTLVTSTVVLATLLSKNQSEFVGHFRQLFTNDVLRVHQTEGFHWKKMIEELRGASDGMLLFTDMLEEVADVICLPMYILGRKLDHHMISEEQLERLRQGACSAMAAKLMTQENGTSLLLTFSRKWHLHDNAAPDDFRKLASIGKWAALFKKVDLWGGWTMQALESTGALREEGMKLSHCVGSGSYSSACINGNAHILSLRRGNHPVATLELRSTPQQAGDNVLTFLIEGEKLTRTFRIMQFRGYDNRAPNEEAQMALDRFKERVASREIQCAKALGGMRADGQGAVSKAERVVGFLLNDRALIGVEAVLDHYANRLAVTGKKGKTRRQLLPADALAQLALQCHMPLV
jgi:hypothetical protein